MKRLVLAVLVMLLAPLVQASMVLDRSILVFAAGDAPRQDVTITNPDPETMFVEVEALDVRHPGTDKEERIVVRNPEEIGLIATPKRLVLPSGASRVIRLVNLAGHGDPERVYRVNVKPVAAPEEETPAGDKATPCAAGTAPRIGFRGLARQHSLSCASPETFVFRLHAMRQ